MKKICFLASLGVLLISVGARAQQVANKTSACDLQLFSVLADNNSYKHIRYSLYHADVSDATVNIVTALFKNDTEIISLSFGGITTNGITDTGFTVLNFGTYRIFSWAFDDQGRFVYSDTNLVNVFNPCTEIISVEEKINDIGSVRIFSIDARNSFKRQYENILFDDRKKILNGIPYGIYVLEFISETNHVVEKYGITP